MAQSSFEIKPRDAALALGAVRALIGVVAIACPTLLASPWIGKDESRRPGARLLARALGGRDLALGLGALITLAKGGDARGWVSAGALADTFDTAATLLAFSTLPKRYRFVVLALTAGASASGAVLAPLMRASE